MEIIKDKDKRTGLITTVILHAVLLLIFAFFGLNYMDPPPEEIGVAINFGFSNDGMNNDPSVTPAEQIENTPTETAVNEPTPVDPVEEQIITQDIDEAPSIAKKEEETKPIPDAVKKEEPKPNENLSNALDKWKNKKSEAGGGDGETGKAGDQGDINGDPNSNSYVGAGGTGDGSFTLAGRSLVSSPKIKDNSQEEGKVVVDIIVDKYGKVLRANPGARGSTTTSSVLYKKAKEAAMLYKFNANPDVPEEQKGTITFIFILN